MNTTILKTIEYLNSVANTDYSPNFKPTVDALTELMKLGYGLSDFKKVIDNKWQDWKGTKFQEYVRPSTLFGKKFENYLNEPRNSKNNITKLIDTVNRAKQATWRLDKK